MCTCGSTKVTRNENLPTSHFDEHYINILKNQRHVENDGREKIVEFVDLTKGFLTSVCSRRSASIPPRTDRPKSEKESLKRRIMDVRVTNRFCQATSAIRQHLREADAPLVRGLRFGTVKSPAGIFSESSS